jgi:hypothetical protein
LDYLTTHTSLSPIRRGFAPGFVNYKKGALAATSDKVYQLLAHGLWFSPGNLIEIRIPKKLDEDTGDSKQSSSQRDYSPGTPASSTTKTGRHDIAEILLTFSP